MRYVLTTAMISFVLIASCNNKKESPVRSGYILYLFNGSPGG